MRRTPIWLLAALCALSVGLLFASGCRSQTVRDPDGVYEHERGGSDVLTLPEMEPADLGGAPLRVVATTSIIGDVAARVGGEAIELTTLMGPDQDPHSYEPTPQEMATVSQAHVILVNGWNLEEALVHDLVTIAGAVPIVPVSAHIEPLAFGGGEYEGEHREGGQEHGENDRHDGTDPHVWFSIRNVEQWVDNIKHTLGTLDPANTEAYANNAETYLAELAELDAYAKGQLSSIPPGSRFLVTNHDAFGYLAHDYGLQVLGTVIPAASTLAEPSASDLAELIEEMEERDICTIFAETSVSDRLAQTVAAELQGCDEVRVVPLYTGALGPVGGGADSYVGMYRSNVDAIVEGLR